MHRVRHPITMFVLAVLAIIGIGVGVVSGLPTASPFHFADRILLVPGVLAESHTPNAAIHRSRKSWMSVAMRKSPLVAR